MSLIVPIGFCLLIGVPYLQLLRKAGLSPAWLLLLLPTVVGLPYGIWLALAVLSVKAWPNRGEVRDPYFFAVPLNVAVAVLHVLPFVSLPVIFRKTGLSGWWGLSILFPPLALCMLWVAAFRSEGKGLPATVEQSRGEKGA